MEFHPTNTLNQLTSCHGQVLLSWVSYEFVRFLGAGSKEAGEVYIVVEKAAVVGGYVELEVEEFKERVIFFFRYGPL